MQNGRRTWPNVANTMENGRRTWPNVANTMQNAKWPFQNVANTTQNDRFYIDGLKLRMRIWKHHSTRAKLKNCILPAFRNLECLPPPRMKLFCNQQLECLQGYIFSRQKHIYILDLPSHHKKKVVHHIIFIVLAILQGIWRFWVYECTCLRISHYFFCALCRSAQRFHEKFQWTNRQPKGTFTRFPHSVTLTKVSFGYKNCDFGHIPEVDRLLGKEDIPSR